MTEDFAPVVAVARESQLWQIVRAVGRVWGAAWTSSVVVSAGRRVRDRFLSMPLEDRVRLSAMSLCWAGIGHVASVLALPTYAVSGLPLAWAAAFITASAVVALFPGAYINAWNTKYGGRSQ